MAYGRNLQAMYKRGVTYIDRILKGVELDRLVGGRELAVDSSTVDFPGPRRCPSEC